MLMRRYGQKMLFTLLVSLLLCGLAACADKPKSNTDFNKLAELTAELDFAPKYVQTFANGFQFTSAEVVEYEDVEILALGYKEPQSGEEISCYMQSKSNAPAVLPPDAQEQQSGDVLLTFYTQKYKFVPVDYELTAADEAAVEDGSMVVSVGTSEVEEQMSSNVIWQADGVYYHLTGMDLSLSADNLLEMAAEMAAN